MSFLTLAVTGAERVNAVHREFARRGASGDFLYVLVFLGLGTAVLFSLLLTLNHLQNRRRAREEARHRTALEAKLRQTSQVPMRC